MLDRYTMPSFRLLLALAAVLWLVIPAASSPASAQASPAEKFFGPVVPVDTSGEPREPAIAGLPGGGFFVVWHDTFTGVPRAQGLGRRLARTGTPLTDPFELSERPGGAFPRAVATDAAGTPVVLLESFDAEPAGLRARAFNPSGTPRGDSFPVFSGAHGGAVLEPTLAAGPEGELVAAASDGLTAYMTRFTADGTLTLEHQQAAENSGGATQFLHATAVLLAGGDAVLGVVEFATGPRLPFFTLYRVSPDGDVAAADFTNQTGGALELAALPDGRLLAVTGGGPGLLTARILSPTLGLQSIRNLSGTTGASEVDLAPEPGGGGYALSWVDGEGHAVAQRFGLDGRPLGDQLTLSNDDPILDPVPPREDDRGPRLVFDGNGVLGVTWWVEGEVTGPLPPGAPSGTTRRTGVAVLFRAAGAVCPEGALCFHQDRFAAQVAWTDPRSGDTGVGNPVPVETDTGTFWFFDPANLELMVKVLDGRVINDHFWVFFGSLTDVAFELTVTDQLTGAVRTYGNPPETFASRGDVTAFAGDP